MKDLGTSVELFLVGEEDVEKKVQEIMAAQWKSTSFSIGTIKYCDITCLCQVDKGILDCSCYGLKEVSLVEEARPCVNKEPSRLEVITKENIGHWCVVQNDAEPYPGIILEVEDYVSEMHA